MSTQMQNAVPSMNSLLSRLIFNILNQAYIIILDKLQNRQRRASRACCTLLKVLPSNPAVVVDCTEHVVDCTEHVVDST